ncbi:hypothetical protein AYI70_g3992 [Smittium culicis]|uniref:Uncharacterized protein n=1 Tax=Smittium culicis TaxID=133412 RepID=A0A1R1Y141_9FUNG|nr:hypothetical protein AYI70_g3992 [Smittium culicis]
MWFDPSEQSALTTLAVASAISQTTYLPSQHMGSSFSIIDAILYLEYFPWLPLSPTTIILLLHLARLSALSLAPTPSQPQMTLPELAD